MSRTAKDRPQRIREAGGPLQRGRGSGRWTPRSFAAETWTGPDRARTRDTCRAAAAEYAADGVIDTDPPTFHHHHGAQGRW